MSSGPGTGQNRDVGGGGIDECTDPPPAPADIDGKQARQGTAVEAELTPEGILLRPQKLIDATQAWFWDPTWQAGERDSDADRAAGRVEAFHSGEALIAGLQSIAKPVRTRRKR